MTISISLDWLSVTIKDFEHGQGFLSVYGPIGEGRLTAPLYGYNTGFTRKDGILVFYNTDRREMGVHLSFPGSALRELRNSGTTMEELVKQCHIAMVTPTRIDLAKDARNEAIAISDIASSCIKGNRQGSIRSFPYVQSPGGGETLYIGSWKSDRFARLYNKAAEQKVDGDWVRLEIVSKDDYAKRLFRALVDNIDAWDTVFNAVMKGMLFVDSGNYDKFLRGGSIPGLPQIEKHADRERWLLTQVLPALTEHLRDKPDSPACAAIKRAIDAVMSEVEGQASNRPD